MPKAALKQTGNALVAFDVEEDHPNWEALSTHFRAWGASDITRTIFSDEEINAAPWLDITAWHHGYPQPNSDSFGYLNATYDLSSWCDVCGTGAKQRAPFQMVGEPKWGRHQILQLTWVYDELFVTPELWSSVFEPFGVAARPVVDRRSTELNSVVQLVISATATLDVRQLHAVKCVKCGREKYERPQRGGFPPIESSDGGAMVRTREYFGSGRLAYHSILAGQALARVLREKDVAGITMIPAGD